MSSVKLREIVPSKQDKTVKYVFTTFDGLVFEMAFIDINDGRNIICVPSETMCNLGCKFCHTAEFIGKIKCRPMSCGELLSGIKTILTDKNLLESPETLLISFMGCGEPLNNIDTICNAMFIIKTAKTYGTGEKRFALATCLAKKSWIGLFELAHEVKLRDIPLKLHFSLHYTRDEQRNEYMPSSLNIKESLMALDLYKSYTGKEVEIHYALIEGVNDTDKDKMMLSYWLEKRDFLLKLLYFNKKDAREDKASLKYGNFLDAMKSDGINTVYYIPPGLDVGASCGQFLMDYYLKYGENKIE